MAVAVLDSLLVSLQSLKPPGASQVKIQEITALCIENIKIEDTLIQTIFSQFKKAQMTHKLGVLYVVDSVTRQWMSKAKANVQPLAGATAPQGTFASGYYKMTQIVPLMMADLLADFPETQKEKIKKLIDIWDQSDTFDKQTLIGYREKLNRQNNAVPPSITPPGIPPSNLMSSVSAQPHINQPPLTVAPNSNDIYAALSSMGSQGSNTTFNQQAPPPYSNVANPPLGGLPPLNLPQSFSAQPASSTPNSINMGNSIGGVANGNLPQLQLANFGQNGNMPANPVVPQQQPPQNDPANNPLIMQVLQGVISNQIKPEEAAQLLQMLGYSAPQPVPPQGAAQPPVSAVPIDPRQGERQVSPQQSRQNGHGNSREYQQRLRSRSPERGGRSSPMNPNRRDSPTYGTYDPAAQPGDSSMRGGRQGDDRRGRGRNRNRNEYRQRSPVPQPAKNSGYQPTNIGNSPRNLEFDGSLPQGHIRVLSRTLFVGGVTASEDELRGIFSRFGNVQTCLVNRDKRHAFVKMVTRVDAVAAKHGMENIQDADINNKVRSTRWGVGFGPRDCCDYTNGVSVVPIDALTDADRKWVVTAENGGTGGVPIDTGLVMEEPDIEIGAGVSSKAISRRLGPDHSNGRGRGGGNLGNRGGFGGKHQHRKNRDLDRQERPHEQQVRQDRPERRNPSPRPEPNTVGVPPPVPGFGFQLPGFPTMKFG